jgi:hypothetical protein
MMRLSTTLAPAARLRRCGPLRAPMAWAQMINNMERRGHAPPYRCTSNLTPAGQSLSRSLPAGALDPIWTKSVHVHEP